MTPQPPASAAGRAGPPDPVASVAPPPAAVRLPRTVARWALGLVLVLAGVSHLTWSRTEFLAQVPPWVPVSGDAVVVGSGVVEIALGSALVLLPRHRVVLGWLVAGFFVVIFPGNVSQLLTRTDGFGLDTDLARGIRLLFQPLLVVWALWSTEAWQQWRAGRTRRP